MNVRIALSVFAIIVSASTGSARGGIVLNRELTPNAHFYFNGGRINRITVDYDASSDALHINGVPVALRSSIEGSPGPTMDLAASERFREELIDLYREVPYVKTQSEKRSLSTGEAVDDCINLELEICRLLAGVIASGGRAVDLGAVRDSVLADERAQGVVDRIELNEFDVSVYFFSDNGQRRIIGRERPQPSTGPTGASVVEMLKIFASGDDDSPRVLVMDNTGIRVIAGGIPAHEIIAQIENIQKTGTYIEGRCSEDELRTFTGK